MLISTRHTRLIQLAAKILIALPATLMLALATPSARSPVPIDFSYAGYEAGRPVPWVKAVLAVKPSGGDDTDLLQGALDRVASMPLGLDGFRGALLLSPGRFHVKGQLSLRASGVLLRGSGAGASGTVIVAEGIDRRPLIVVGAVKDVELGPAIQVQEDVSTGGQTLHLASVADLKAGDQVVVRRPSTQEWNTAMSMTGLPGTFASQRLDWRPGSHDLVWDRVLTAVNAQANTVELDAPITTALEQKYGGGTLAPVAGGVAPENIGIEDLVLESSYDKTRPKDEDHSWIAILMDHVQDAWVRDVIARHFVSSAVRVNLRGRRITVENCRNEAPVSEEGGYRRQSFLVAGQQVLVYRCHSENGMNDFASGMLAGGPNVFLDCDATGSPEASGAFEGWSSGVLYENVHVPDARLQLILDFSRAQGAGWNAANSLIWNSTARSLDAAGPPGARNFVVNSPQPLYETELTARTGLHLTAAVPTHAANTQTLPEFGPNDVKLTPDVRPVFHPAEIG